MVRVRVEVGARRVRRGDENNQCREGRRGERSGEAGFEIPQRECDGTCVAAARMTGWSTTVSLEDEKSTTRAPRRKAVGSMSDSLAWRSIYRSILRICAGQSVFFGGN